MCVDWTTWTDNVLAEWASAHYGIVVLGLLGAIVILELADWYKRRRRLDRRIHAALEPREPDPVDVLVDAVIIRLDERRREKRLRNLKQYRSLERIDG